MRFAETFLCRMDLPCTRTDDPLTSARRNLIQISQRQGFQQESDGHLPCTRIGVTFSTVTTGRTSLESSSRKPIPERMT